MESMIKKKKMKWFGFCISIVMVPSMNLMIFMDRFVEQRIAVVCNKIDLNDYVVSSQLNMVKGNGLTTSTVLLVETCGKLNVNMDKVIQEVICQLY